MVMYILRGAFLVLVASVLALYLLPNQEDAGVQFGPFVLIMSTGLVMALVVIAGDVILKQKKLSAMSGVFLGLVAGLVVAYAFSRMVDLIPLFMPSPQGVNPQAFRNLLEGVKVLIGLVTCYMSISMVLQTKDDFRFVIPYVEFAKQIRGSRPTVLDTSVIIDGRILEIIDTNVLQGTLVVPKFVLNELQAVADSSDRLRRARGRRGLDILQKLQERRNIDISINETETEGLTVDQKLLVLSKDLQARLMTNDFNLAKIAMLRGVDVINLNDLAKALRPVALPGETMRVKVVKPGEAANQGVGYLEDGTMVVVENARQFLHQDVDLVVTSTLQTSAGRMIFGRCSGGPDEQAHDGNHAAGQGDDTGQGSLDNHEPYANGNRLRTPNRGPRRV